MCAYVYSNGPSPSESNRGVGSGIPWRKDSGALSYRCPSSPRSASMLTVSQRAEVSGVNSTRNRGQREQQASKQAERKKDRQAGVWNVLSLPIGSSGSRLTPRPPSLPSPVCFVFLLALCISFGSRIADHVSLIASLRPSLVLRVGAWEEKEADWKGGRKREKKRRR